MPIVADNSFMFQFTMTPALAAFMAAHRIKTMGPGLGSRWREGDVISASRTLVLRPHVVMLDGAWLLDIDSFSYSFSPLAPHIRIGRYCSIALNVRVMGPQHPLGFVSSSEILYRADTMLADSLADFGAGWHLYPHDISGGSMPEIGHDVWIGQDVLLGPRAKLGDGCVVAAGSVVTRPVPPYAIVGGVPARVIRFRFPPEIVEALLESRWWDYALPELNHLPLDRPEAFVVALRAAIEAGNVVPYAPNLGFAFDVISAIG